MKINWYSALKKSTIGLLLFYIGLVFSQVTTPECPVCDVCEAPMSNVWCKLSTDEYGVQHTIKLDMQIGVSYSEGPYYVLELIDADNGEIIYVDGNKNSKYVNGEVSDKITDLELLAKLQTSESILGSRILRNDKEED